METAIVQTRGLVPLFPSIQDKEALAKASEPKQCLMTFAKIKTPLLAAESQTPVLSAIRKEHGDNYVTGLVAKHILSLTQFLGDKCKMTKDQILETAFYIVEDFYWLNIADIVLIMKNIKTENISFKLYESLNGQKILQAVEEYALQRAEDVERSKNNREEIIKKHGYDKTNERADDTKLAGALLDYQMEAEAKKAHEELILLDHNYRLHEAMKTVSKITKKTQQ